MRNNNTFFKIILQNVKREWSWKLTGLTGIHEACLSIQQNQMLKLAAICKIWRSRHFWIHKNNYISTVIVYGKDCHKFSNFNEFIAFQWYENCWYPDLVQFLFNLRWRKYVEIECHEFWAIPLWFKKVYSTENCTCKPVTKIVHEFVWRLFGKYIMYLQGK